MIPKFMNDPFLLVLDLNGTLLYRKKSKSGKCGSVVARPYLQSFLRYCLGACYDMDAKAFAKAWPFKDREPVYFNVPGSDMWDTCKLSSYALPLPVGTKFYPPRTPIFVTIWSSATYSNVIQMIELITHSDVQRTLFQRVWSRDTLVTTFDSHRKVSTTKDLTIVWDELNRWSMYLENRISAKEKLCFRSRALADMRYCAWLDMMRHRASSIEKKISNMRSEQCLFYEAMERSNGRMLDLMYGPLMHTPFGPKNTILLDDSIGKARCQPNNHVCIPEYVKDEAAEREYPAE